MNTDDFFIKGGGLYRKQCRFCKYHRFGDITVFTDFETQGKSFDGRCLFNEKENYPIVPVDGGFCCSHFKPRGD